MADDGDLFKTAPAGVTRYFNAKQSVPTFDWRDIAPEEHAFSWTVAKSTGHDVLDDIRSAMADAIENRVPEREFIARLTPILQEKGWWGKQIAVDPADGVAKPVHLGSPRRLRTIYWSNVRTAHAAGEWERTERNKAFLPFLVYTLSVAERRRPEHEGWAGTILPVDDSWWDTHYPPNGWGCKCGVRQISRGEARRLGWSEDQETPPRTTEPWLNKRTGETVMVPKGIDPGWANNPGKARGRNVSEFLYGKVASIPANRQRIAIEDIVGSPILKAMADGQMPKGSFLPVAQLADKIVREFGANSNLVRLSADSVEHILNEYSARGLTVEDFRLAISVLRAPRAVVRQGPANPAAIVLGSVRGAWWRVVIKSVGNGAEWWLNSFHRKSDRAVDSFVRRARERGELIE
jgi:hypothetical protein